jgi:hypothetical protein
MKSAVDGLPGVAGPAAVGRKGGERVGPASRDAHLPSEAVA